MTLTKCYSGSGRRSLDHVCADSFQRLRTPDHLPMDHTPSQARQQAMQQRQRRVTNAQNVRKACMDSGSLRQYSKKRFEFAVQNVSMDLDRGRVLPRPSTTPAKSSHWTGPTPTGSLLYNRVPLMLNSIRVRPNSETARYDHVERTYPDIERTMRQSNKEFTVRNLNLGENMMSSRANSLMSRGNSQTYRENSLMSRGDSTTQRANMLTPRTHALTSCGHYPLSRGTTPRSVTTEFILVPVGERSEFYNDVKEFLPPENEDGWYADKWNPLTPRPQVVLEMTEQRGPEVMSESCSSESTLPGSRPLTEDSFRNTQQSSRCTLDVASSNRLGVSGQGQPLTGSRKTGSELSLSESLSSTTSSRSERPKCWVDDVTISSEMTAEGEDNGDIIIEDTKQKLESMTNLDKFKPKSKTDTKQEKMEDKVEEVPLEEVEKMEEVIQEEEEEFVESPRLEFPNFLCPSSERKSRQAAIKMWLANTSFTCADRSVPLL